MKSIVAIVIIVICSMNILAQDKSLSLNYLVKHPKTENDKTPLIILLHGVGSNETDLFSFANQLPDNYLIISARAPHTIGQASYAWYQVDFSTGKPVYNTQQSESSRKIILKFIEELKTTYQFDHQKIYLVGFSQGAIMSYAVGLSNPCIIKGIGVMSGRLLEDTKPLIKKDHLKSLSVFISHGTEDPVLGIHYAREANTYLKELNVTPVFKEYKDGHTINQLMLKDLIDWLPK